MYLLTKVVPITGYNTVIYQWAVNFFRRSGLSKKIHRQHFYICVELNFWWYRREGFLELSDTYRHVNYVTFRNKRFEPSAQCAVADWIHSHGAVPECYTHTPTTSTSARHTRVGHCTNLEIQQGWNSCDFCNVYSVIKWSHHFNFKLPFFQIEFISNMGKWEKNLLKDFAWKKGHIFLWILHVFFMIWFKLDC